MKNSRIAIFASAFLAIAPTIAYAETNETPQDHSAHHPAPAKPDDKAKEQHGGGGHEGDCCKMMKEMHEKMGDMHEKMHGAKDHDSKGSGGEHGGMGGMMGH